MATSDDIEWEDDSIEWEGDTPATPARKPTSMLQRAARGFVDPMLGIGQLVGQRLTDEDGNDLGSVADFKKQLDKDYVAPEGMDWARMGGNALNPVTWAGGRAAGGVQGFIAPTEQEGAAGLQERLINAGTGLVAGEAMRQGVPAVLRGLRPGNPVRAQNLDVLTEAGVQPTVAQARGPGMISGIESMARKVPIVGNIVAKAQNRPLIEAQEQFISRALENPDIIRGVPPNSQARVANDYITNLYRTAQPDMRIDNQGIQRTLAELRTAARSPGISPDGRREMNAYAAQLRSMQASGNTLTPDQIQTFGSELAAGARRNMRSDTPSDNFTANVLNSVRGNYADETERVMRSLGYTDSADTVRQANRAYARMVPINEVASRNTDRSVMPHPYSQAYARQQGGLASRLGGSADEDFINAAVETLPGELRKGPEFFSPGTIATGVLGVTNPMTTIPAVAAGTALSGAMYPRAVQAALTGRGRNANIEPYINPAVAALRGGMYNDDSEESMIQRLLRQQDGEYYAP